MTVDMGNSESARKPEQKFWVRTSTLDARFDMREDASMVHPALLVFAQAVGKKLPHVKFAPMVGARRELWFYDPHQPYVLGTLLYNDILEKYGVEARGIKNERFGSMHSEYVRLWSTNMSTAVKKVAANAVPWTIGELASLSVKDYKSARDEELGDVKSKVVNLLKNLGMVGVDTQVFSYLRSQVKGNARLGDQGFHDDAYELVQTHEYLAELQGQGATPLFVHIGEDKRGRQYLDTAWVGTEFVYRTVRFTPRNRAYEGEPEFDNLVGKLSVLNMTEPNHYVRGVGMKHADDMFYVTD